jgi:hypothetical protein
LYNFTPFMLKKKGSTLKTVWLRLRSEHYTWLKPKADLTPEIAKAAMANASAKLDHLKGAGRSGLLSLLGVDAASSCSAGSRATGRAKAKGSAASLKSTQRFVQCKSPRATAKAKSRAPNCSVKAASSSRAKPQSAAVRAVGISIAASTTAGNGYSPACPHCGFEYGSARHLWQDCPRFEVARRQLGHEYDVHHDWWQRQPRVTSKSGWITMAAHADVKKRALLQIMSCRLALQIYATVDTDAYQG